MTDDFENIVDKEFPEDHSVQETLDKIADGLSTLAAPMGTMPSRPLPTRNELINLWWALEEWLKQPWGDEHRRVLQELKFWTKFTIDILYPPKLDNTQPVITLNLFSPQEKDERKEE